MIKNVGIYSYILGISPRMARPQYVTIFSMGFHSFFKCHIASTFGEHPKFGSLYKHEGALMLFIPSCSLIFRIFKRLKPEAYTLKQLLNLKLAVIGFPCQATSGWVLSPRPDPERDLNV